MVLRLLSQQALKQSKQQERKFMGDNQKAYKSAAHAQINLKYSTIVPCVCGQQYRQIMRPAHMRSDFHKAFMTAHPEGVCFIMKSL